MQLDEIAPPQARGHADSRFVAKAPGGVFAAIQRITPEELPMLGRALRVGGGRIPIDAKKPLYAQMLGLGYTVLATTPLREVIVGRAARPTGLLHPEPRVKDKRELAAFDTPGHLKLLLAFQLVQEEQRGVRGTRVTAALRAWGSDAATDRRLSLFWPAIRLGGNAAARAWLKALGTRLA